MKIYFQIIDNMVVNNVVQSDDFIAPEGEIWLESEGVGGIGWSYDPETNTVSAPPLPPTE